MEQSKHPLQKLMDNPWLLLGLSFTITFVSYTLWGLLEIMNTPTAKLP
jgi:hypothetical protein